MYYTSGQTPEYRFCDTMGIYSQGEDLYYKDGGSGIVFKPGFTDSELDSELGYCKVEFGKHTYLIENEIYGIIEPYSRHIVKTTTKSSPSKERIVNVDNGHVFDL
ncbi:MAG: hypothetical protein MJ233_04900 [Mycoplasmoidaceae bacterium]|nr:hypothetical protein [Mycoplasmoidaceae bacterium]